MWNIKRKVTVGAVQVCLTPKGGVRVVFRKERENHKMFCAQMQQKVFQAGALADRLRLSLTMMWLGKSWEKGNNHLDAEAEHVVCPWSSRSASHLLPKGKHCLSLCQRPLHSQNPALPYTYLFPNFIPVPMVLICLFSEISASEDILHSFKN